MIRNMSVVLTEAFGLPGEGVVEHLGRLSPAVGKFLCHLDR